jgi:O-antigen/teichoic acid export membrane protein
VFIPKFGKEGSAIATVAAQLIVPAYLFYKGQKVYFIPYKYAEVVIAMAAMALVVVIIRFISFNSLAFQVVVKILTSLLLLGFVIVANKAKLQMVLSGLKKKKVISA